MATVYKIQVTSHWISYSEESLNIEREKGNTIQFNVIERQIDIEPLLGKYFKPFSFFLTIFGILFLETSHSGCIFGETINIALSKPTLIWQK